MTTITKERLLTIKQWRETYGLGSNVVLPAEEAEELARIALASLEAEPLVPVMYKGMRLLTKEGLELIRDGIAEATSLEAMCMAEALLSVPSDLPASERERIRHEHAGWSDATFGDVGPVGPLKHLSKEALEAAADPSDPLEWADMQFLLWDAQRRAGISDERITQAMVEKLAVNKQREWPEPNDGEPLQHVKEQPAPVAPGVLERLRSIVTDPRALPRRKEWISGQQYSYVLLENVEAMIDEACRAAPQAPVVPEEISTTHTMLPAMNDQLMAVGYVKGWNACRAAMLQSKDE